MTRRLFAEWLGTLFLLAVIIGSGIMADRLSGGIEGLALLGNTLPTGAILVVIILIFGPVSGAHFNPAVTLVFALRGDIRPTHAVQYIIVQIIGGICGVMIAQLMFDLPLIDLSTIARTGVGKWTGEFVATFGLIATILGCLKSRPDAVPYAVGLYITAGYWFTSSTSFANPAVTIARSLSDTFAGISPAHIPVFILVQLFAAVVAAITFDWLFGRETDPAK
ncbi:MAG: aquaporin family protein [Cohaesibacteraceae bacterium]|nr:aquaporin family protein [Cohaesibacteraceae bacterium]